MILATVLVLKAVPPKKLKMLNVKKIDKTNLLWYRGASL